MWSQFIIPIGAELYYSGGILNFRISKTMKYDHTIEYLIYYKVPNEKYYLK